MQMKTRDLPVSVPLLLCGVVLLSFVLRTPIVAFGPVAEMVRADLGVSASLIGLVAALPMLAFALCSPFAPKLAARFGIENVLLASIVLLMAGLLWRAAVPSVAVLLAGTALLSGAIAMGNVLMPALAKRSLPDRVGLVVGAVSATMSVSSATAAAVAVPLAHWRGWSWSLAVWLLPAAAALAVWALIRWRQGSPTVRLQSGAPVLQMWRLPAAWLLSVFMGVQSLMFYSVVGFLPAVLTEQGLSEQAAGGYSALFQAASLIGVLLASVYFAKSNHRQHWCVAMSALMLAGLAGFWLWPTQGTVCWAVLLGIGGSGVFSAILMLFALRTDNAQEAAALSGMAQTVGYTLAFFGPFGMGLLYDLLGNWRGSFGLLTALMAVETVLAWWAASPKTMAQTQKS